ncbi:molybdopterin molybdotransferase MoeA [Dactylosporangium sp. NPDC048998]|uniref:molybdopterin molybdotransferase MoeA n=1 Tax=Dactylosporangium sp. NPDC048998 TaxID=3363976 RepID=UPI003723E866
MTGIAVQARQGCAHPAAAMPWHEARALAHRLPHPTGKQRLPVEHAAGRTLALPLRAATTLPGFDNAAMDGYATRGPGPWRVVDRVLAGQWPAVQLAPGEAAEIATGAPVPAGTDRVVEYEVTTRIGDVVSADPGPRRHLRRRGEYVTTGDELLPAGHLLTPAGIGLAAGAGVDTVTVHRPPAVRILITGDEIVTSGSPERGKVRDAVGPLLTGLLTAWGARRPELRRVPDHPSDALATALTSVPAGNDLTIVCGSSSVGPADGLHRALHDIGALLHVDGVDCRPGHPQVLAQAGERWLVGVPGNPFAALVAAVTLLQPLLAGLAGRALPDLPRAPLRGDVRPAPGRTRLVPVRRRDHEVHLIEGAHPGYLGPAAQAEALAVLPPAWRDGTTVELVPL